MDMIKVLAIIGLIFSIYGTYVLVRKRKKNKYKPVCDISSKISCSEVLSSTYGRVFLFDNTVWGILAYSALLLFGNVRWIVLPITAILFLGSIYLSIILAVKIRRVCILCIGVYAINILLAVFVFLQ